MKSIFTAASYQLTLTTVAIAVSFLAGLGLVTWGMSPYAYLLEHDNVAMRGWPDLLFVCGWLLMCIAMMLPTALPLLAAIERLTKQRADTGQLTAIAALGFLGVWLGSGLLVRGIDVILHTSIHQIGWLSVHPQRVGAILASLAGIYLLLPIAQSCVSACQSPLGFIARAWTGLPDVRMQVARMGWEYGLSCFGCCWPLMAVMCALGMGNSVWMLVFTLVMILQKHDRYGKLVTTASGVILLAIAAILLLGTVSLDSMAHHHSLSQDLGVDR
jgi:predicted metal-binding membrane protein